MTHKIGNEIREAKAELNHLQDTTSLWLKMAEIFLIFLGMFGLMWIAV